MSKPTMNRTGLIRLIVAALDGHVWFVVALSGSDAVGGLGGLEEAFGVVGGLEDRGGQDHRRGREHSAAAGGRVSESASATVSRRQVAAASSSAHRSVDNATAAGAGATAGSPPQPSGPAGGAHAARWPSHGRDAAVSVAAMKVFR